MKRGRFAEEQVIGVLIEVDTPISNSSDLRGGGDGGIWGLGYVRGFIPQTPW